VRANRVQAGLVRSFRPRRRGASWLARLAVVAVTIAAVGAVGARPGAAAGAPPTIDVWYGDTQAVGAVGRTQEWANVLGNVHDLDDTVTSLTYSLNGGPARPLTIGGDTHFRLVGWGDFNVEIDRDLLVPGNNSVVLTATDQAGNQTRRTVTLTNTPTRRWPLPTQVDWSGATRPTERVDVVDGLWSVDPGGATVEQPGYDRLLAVGDVTWTDYEVEVPVTVHSFNETEGGIGLFLRWTGHTEHDPHRPGMQPRAGWHPSGALAWYRGLHSHPPRVELAASNETLLAADGSGFRLNEGSTYIFRASVQRTPSGDRYRTTVFPQGQPASAGVTIQGLDTAFTKAAGSVLLLAHRSVVTFGDITVTEIDGEPPPPPPNEAPVAADDEASTAMGDPVIVDVVANDRDSDGSLVRSSVDVVAGPAHGSVSVNPTTGAVRYSPAAGFVGDDAFTYTVDDDDGATSNVATVSVTVSESGPPPSSGLVSDEFSSSTLGAQWEWFDPVGDGTRAATGSHAALSVPAGVSHDLWTGALRAPRLLQDADDTDFEVEVKIDSPVTSAYELQGLVAQQDADDLIRFEVHHDGGSPRVFVATIDDGRASGRANVPAPAGAPYWLRLGRDGDSWTFERSGDGVTWQTITTLNFDLSLSQVGLFVGNHTPAPQHTAEFDYFRVTGGGSPPPPTPTTTTTTTTVPSTTTTTAPSTTTTTRPSTTTTTAPTTTTTTTAPTTTTSTVPTTTTTTTPPPPPPPSSGLVSDEFTSSTFGDHWSWLDPVGDATRSATGSHAALSVPAGVSHDLWTGALRAPRLLQEANDTDFTVEAKIDSSVTSTYQMQGLVVQEGVADLIRFEVHGNGGSTRAFVATVDGGVATGRANVSAPSSGPHWLRLSRDGDTWTFQRSANGTTWQTVTTFSFDLSVEQVGLFVANHTPSPQHTARFDHFRVIE
jgi:regulation of enolase protein 1 (concanavalin A-like superfamily)